MSTTVQIPQFSPTKLQEALDRSGLTKGHVARMIGGDGERAERNGRNALTWYLNGRRVPTMTTIYKLAVALGVRIEDLCEVGGDDA